jgi:hypothetical protein
MLVVGVVVQEWALCFDRDDREQTPLPSSATGEAEL